MDTTPQSSNRLMDSSKDALQALKALAINPVGGFSTTFDSLGAARALGVGIVYGAAFALCLLFATYLVLSDWWGRPQGFTGFVKILVISIVPFISFFAAATATRKVLRAEGTLGHDSFVAGASLLPFGGVVLFGALLGIGNVEVTAAFALFTACLTILMLFTGLTRIFKTSERAATFAIPVMLLASAWFSKVIYTVLLG